MTSLTETLPILEEAVPALPPKIEAVAREGQAFQKAAREALAEFQQRRAQADSLVEQLREALETVREQADGERQQAEEIATGLRELVEEEVQGTSEGTDDLQNGSDEANAALGQLESELAQGEDRARAANEEARTALDTLREQAASDQAELDGAAQEMTAAVQAAEQAIVEGQGVVAQAVASLGETMGRLLAEARARLHQTQEHLDRLQSEQDAAVAAALSELESRREQVEKEVTERVGSEVRDALDGELDTAMTTLGEMGQEVVQLQADCQTQREDLEQQVAGVAERMPPLQGSVEQVKGAAQQVGLAWS